MDALSFHRLLENDGDPCASVMSGVYDRGLHVASVFIIFVASAIGVAAPLAPKYSPKLSVWPYALILGKCAGVGVMLSCGLVHMIQPAAESLTSECVPYFFNTTYPAFAFLTALVAILMVHASEFVLESFLTRSVISGTGERKANFPGNGSEAVADEGKGTDQAISTSIDKGGQDLNVLSTKQFSEALMVEFSLSVHSVIIGISVGVSNRETLATLLVALVFHQLFEGVALGCRLADSAIGVWNVLVFAFFFSISAPIGIVIGICVYQTVNLDGQTYLLVQGIFDGFCGGILLYNGFLILMKDFNNDIEKYCRGENRQVMIWGMFIVLWVLALLMALIGAWL